jgi:hypothetical protein
MRDAGALSVIGCWERRKKMPTAEFFPASICVPLSLVTGYLERRQNMRLPFSSRFRLRTCHSILFTIYHLLFTLLFPLFTNPCFSKNSSLLLNALN